MRTSLSPDGSLLRVMCGVSKDGYEPKHKPGETWTIESEYFLHQQLCGNRAYNGTILTTTINQASGRWQYLLPFGNPLGTNLIDCSTMDEDVRIGWVSLAGGATKSKAIGPSASTISSLESRIEEI